VNVAVVPFRVTLVTALAGRPLIRPCGPIAVLRVIDPIDLFSEVVVQFNAVG